MYLEAFRLPGEAPVISYILEHFASYWQVGAHFFLHSSVLLLWRVNVCLLVECSMTLQHFEVVKHFTSYF